MRQGKKWGYTTEIFRNAMVSAHHLEIKKDGFCSEHIHVHKFNQFYVTSGKLEITIFRDDPERPMVPEVKDITILMAGQKSAVPPGLWHTFRGIEETECIEIYQVLLIDPDIDRRTQGGKK